MLILETRAGSANRDSNEYSETDWENEKRGSGSKSAIFQLCGVGLLQACFSICRRRCWATRLCKHLPPLRAHCYVALSKDWGSSSGCFLPQHQDKTQILFSGLPSQLCTCFLLHSSYTHTLGPLRCVSWDPNSH